MIFISTSTKTHLYAEVKSVHIWVFILTTYFTIEIPIGKLLLRSEKNRRRGKM